MLHHKRVSPPSNPEYPGILEVIAWSGPTRTFLLTGEDGTQRLRVEMLASDVHTESLAGLGALLELIEDAADEQACSCGPVSSAPLELVPTAPLG